MKIPRNFIIEHGPTKGCPHCVIIVAGKEKGPGHNEACRRRMEEIMKGTAEGMTIFTKGNERMTEAFLRRLEQEGVEPNTNKKKTEDEGVAPREEEGHKDSNKKVIHRVVQPENKKIITPDLQPQHPKAPSEAIPASRSPWRSNEDMDEDMSLAEWYKQESKRNRTPQPALVAASRNPRRFGEGDEPEAKKLKAKQSFSTQAADSDEDMSEVDVKRRRIDEMNAESKATKYNDAHQRPKIMTTRVTDKEEPEAKRVKISDSPSNHEAKMEDEADELDAKRRRIDELSKEAFAVKYLPPIIGHVDKHVVNDFIRMNKNGKPWNFSSRASRAAAVNKMINVKPSLVIAGELRSEVEQSKQERHAKFVVGILKEQA